MSVPYDVFTNAFLDKVMEYDFANLKDFERNGIVDGYMKHAISSFKHMCKYDFYTTGDDIIREFDVEVDDGDLDEIADIISEGMVYHWLKPYAYHQDNLLGVLNTKDFTTYSRAELIMRIGNAYTAARKDFVRMMRDYSYFHGDLTDLHT